MNMLSLLEIFNDVQTSNSIGSLEKYDGSNFKNLIDILIQRIPTLKTYNKFNNDKGSYSGVQFQKIKHFGKQKIVKGDTVLEIEDLIVSSEFSLSYRHFNGEKHFYIDFTNKVTPIVSKYHKDPLVNDLLQRMLFIIHKDINEKLSYSTEIPIKDGEVFPQQEFDTMINHLNKLTFDLDTHLERSFKVLFEESKKLNEAIYYQNGTLLIYGAPLKDNTRRLYVTYTKNYAQQNRVKSDNTAGIPNRNITISNDIYRISMIDGKLVAKGVAWHNQHERNTYVGLNGNNVGLNWNKTPLHQDTLQFNDIRKMLNTLSDSIIHLPNVKWQS